MTPPKNSLLAASGIHRIDPRQRPKVFFFIPKVHPFSWTFRIMQAFAPMNLGESNYSSPEIVKISMKVLVSFERRSSTIHQTRDPIKGL